MTLQAITKTTIFTGDERLEGKALVFQEDEILGIVEENAIPSEAECLPLPGCLLVPGLIDLQVNGGGNVLLNATPTKEGVLVLAKAHQKAGTTRLLPTCITDAPEVLPQAFQAVREARKENPGILGLHCEGPHISRAGIHPKAYLRPLEERDIAFYAPQGDEIILVTLSPDKATPEQIARLAASGVLVSLGHTESPPEIIIPALRAGARGFTHLFNGMGGISARLPGPAGTALDDRESWCGILADGIHVSPTTLRVALHAKQRGKLFIVSDALPPAGAYIPPAGAYIPPAGADDPQSFLLVDKMLHVEGVVCVDEGGAIGGSALTLLEMLRIAIKTIGIEADEAFRMASAYPAAFIGKERELGRLASGFKADILALDQDFNARAVWCAGLRL